MNSLHGVTKDSTRLLTEKLTLSRELTSLKPELEHLRSQASTNQSLLSEKLSLQRQLSSLQVELANEKRNMEKILAKEDRQQAEDSRLGKQLENLKTELAKEKRERQNLEREAQKENGEWENTKTNLESRLDAFRNKLKTTKEQLKDSQAALQRAQVSASTAQKEPAKAAGANKISRKRGLAEVEADTMIGTPGILPPPKRGNRASTLPGDKSTFSITPFLNRTASVAPDNPPANTTEECATSDVEATDPGLQEPKNLQQPSPSANAAKSKAAKKSGVNEPPGTSRARKGPNTDKPNPIRGPSRRTRSVLSLAQVMEEENDENEAPKTSDNGFREGVEFKRKKHKILGKTLFDEDDGEGLRDEKGSTLGVIRGLRRGIGLKPAPGVFGAISPLKKDKS